MFSGFATAFWFHTLYLLKSINMFTLCCEYSLWFWSGFPVCLTRHKGYFWSLCVLALQLKDAFLISSFTSVCQKCRLIKVWGATQGQLYKQKAIFLFIRLLWSVKKKRKKKVSDTAIEFHTNSSKQTPFCLSVYLLMPPTSVFSRL